MVVSEHRTQSSSHHDAHVCPKRGYVLEKKSNVCSWDVNGTNAKALYRHSRNGFGGVHLDVSHGRSTRRDQQLVGQVVQELRRESWIDPDAACHPWAPVARNAAPYLAAPGLDLVGISVETIVETYEGFVEGIEGATAFVRLHSAHGDTLYGRYPANKLEIAGISERQPFLCRVVDRDGGKQIRLEAIPEKELTPKRLREIDDEVDRAMSYDGPEDDY